MTKCQYSENCNGCDLWELPYSEQRILKIEGLRQLLKANNIKFDSDINFVEFGDRNLRHRVDFTLLYDEYSKKHQFGFYDKNKKLLDIKKCLQLAPNLQEIYNEFTSLHFYYRDIPIKKGSVRLRVSPGREKACWLDFSNIDIKNLLEDQTLLKKLIENGFIVEIGQKGKRLIINQNHLKLSDPNSAPLFQTINDKDMPIDLFCRISDFTQPSWLTASAISKMILNIVKKNDHIQHIVEFGSGIGQYTLSLLSAGKTVTACEINDSACEQLLFNAKNHGLMANLNIIKGDFHKISPDFLNEIDLVLVNPARSGLKKFTDYIINVRPEYVIYVSCFPESMIEDLKYFSDKFSICNITIFDQFPQTKHFETLIELKKLN